MEIRALSGEALGVEVLNADLRTATADDIERMVDAMHRTGRGVMVVRDQHLRPLDCERACALLAPHFVAQQPYTRWPGQSKPIPGCPHLALLGNYRAREDGEFGMDVVKGEVIGEYKPAANTLEEWHTDGSFLPMPKVAIALYAPQLDARAPNRRAARPASPAAPPRSSPWTRRPRVRREASRRCTRGKSS